VWVFITLIRTVYKYELQEFMLFNVLVEE
jgi:hypothetical protein